MRNVCGMMSCLSKVYICLLSVNSTKLQENHQLQHFTHNTPVPMLSSQVAAYDNDELNFHGGMRVSFGMQLMGATARIEREIASISWPFLLLHGDADKLCDIRGSKMMFENAPSTDKRLKVWTRTYKGPTASTGCSWRKHEHNNIHTYNRVWDLSCTTHTHTH